MAVSNPRYTPADRSIMDSIKNNRILIAFYIIYIAFIIVYFVLIDKLIKKDPTGYTTKYRKISIITFIIGIVILLSGIISFSRVSSTNTYEQNRHTDMSLWGTSLMYILGGSAVIGLLIGLIYLFVYLSEKYKLETGATGFILNSLLIIAGVLGVFYALNHYLSHTTNPNGIIPLIVHSILFIPCFVIDLFKYIYKALSLQVKLVSKPILLLLLIELVVVLGYIFIPKLYTKIITQNGKILLSNPIYLTKETTLATYDQLNPNHTSLEHTYRYALSCWIYIDAQPPNTGQAYQTYTPLFSYGGKPVILYKGITNTILVKSLKGIRKENTIYKYKNVTLQKWNNWIINYSGGTLDVFLNGDLVASEKNIVPYMQYENIVAGTDHGINGGICNVIYFDKVLSGSDIKLLYNSGKNKTPPVL
jgi:hypothetical protein